MNRARFRRFLGCRQMLIPIKRYSSRSSSLRAAAEAGLGDSSVKAGQRKTSTTKPPFEWNPRCLTDRPIEWHKDGTIKVPLGTEYGPRDIYNLVRRFSLEELLPLLTSLIGQGRLELVEKLIARIQASHAHSWPSHNDVSLANALLRAYLERDRLEEAVRWREFIFARKSVRPDPLTYSILFRFLLTRTGKGAEDQSMVLEEIRHLHDEMVSKDGLNVKQLLSKVEYLDADEGRRLAQIVRGDPKTSLHPEGGEGIISVHIDPSDINGQERSSWEGGGSALPDAESRESQLPNVSEIKTKSDGIMFLKEALRMLRENPGTNVYALQERLERDCYHAGAQMLRKDLEDYQAATSSVVFGAALKRLLLEWQEQLTKHLTRILSGDIVIKKGADGGKDRSGEDTRYLGSASNNMLYGAFLSCLEVDKVSFIVLQELARSTSYDAALGGIPVAKIALAIGCNLERELFAAQISRMQFLEHTSLTPRHLARVFGHRGRFERTMREQYAILDKNVEALRDGWIPRWSPRLRAELGAFLLDESIERLSFQDQRAFTHRLGTGANGNNLGLITPCEPLLRLLASEGGSLPVEPWALPMLVPPRPWLTSNSGGYLTQRMCCVRVKDDPVHFAIIQQADKSGSLEKILLGLDILGRTPWRINESVLDVALSLWNSGVNVSVVEELRSHQQRRQQDGGSPTDRQPSAKMEYRKREQFESQAEYVQYVREAIGQREAQAKAHSTMCDTNYKLEIARQFVGIPFYLPHSVDFRGRAYPIPPHLSHIGSDLSRGLLIFSEGKPLGERGLGWLKIQLANMAGYDKASRQEREAWAETHKDLILDSADNPLSGHQWWRQADEPWQCLAACMELAAAWRSPDPTTFISHLPCQQDGSCNGLQHYAALGRDVDGATQVNLAPGDRPADVYAAVARLVAAQVESDATEGEASVSPEICVLAGKLVGKVNRKIIKQPVMTNVYGVTPYGARQQIEDRLKEYRVVPPEDYKQARAYLARLVFRSLGTLFDRAQQIQNWLTETAAEIARSVPREVALKMGYCEGQGAPAAAGEKTASSTALETDPSYRYPQTSVCWTTPLGFQVLQPYNRQRTIQLRTVLQSLSLRISSRFDPVDVGKQASAFPPNFVHSLDATHMFKTALACADAELTFASVHDCFWTHAASVDEMNRILREQFVALHQEPVLERLREEFLARYHGYVVPVGGVRMEGESKQCRALGGWRPISIRPLPPRGDFDIEKVLMSDYFFS